MTACSDSLVRVFDSRTGQCLMYDEYNDLFNAQGCSYAILLQASWQHRFGRSLLVSSHLPRSLYGHTNSVEHVAFNGKTIISGGSDG